jgi:hypothetical protein
MSQGRRFEAPTEDAPRSLHELQIESGTGIISLAVPVTFPNCANCVNFALDTKSSQSNAHREKFFSI